MSVEWMDVEEPPAESGGAVATRRSRWLPVVVLAVLAAALGGALAGRESVVTGHGAGALPLGVLVNPDDPSSGSLVLGMSVGSITLPDAHTIIYVIGLRNTRTTPLRVARVAVQVAATERHDLIGVRLVTLSDAAMTTPLTPPRSVGVIPPGSTVGLWVALRYLCTPQGVLEIAHPTVTITTDPHDSLRIGPDDGLVAPDDPGTQAACDRATH